MRRALFVAGMLLWDIGTYAAPASRTGGCALTALESVELGLSEDSIYVPVTLNDRAGWLSLMTSGARSYLRESALGELTIPVNTAQGEDGFGWAVEGKTVTQIAPVARAKLGSVTLPLQQWFIRQATSESQAFEGRPVFGWLATDLLWRFDFELDLAHKKLTLYPHNRCAGKVVYWSEQYGRVPVDISEFGTLYFPVDLMGKKIEATFVSTVRDTYVSATLARRLFGIEEHSAGVETQVDAAGESAVFFRAPKLTSEDMTLTDVRIQLRKTSDNCRLTTKGRTNGAIGFDRCYGVYPLGIGRREMEKLRLYFAPKEQAIYFTANGAGN
jgi:hypothetical protein